MLFFNLNPQPWLKLQIGRETGSRYNRTIELWWNLFLFFAPLGELRLAGFPVSHVLLWSFEILTHLHIYRPLAAP